MKDSEGVTAIESQGGKPCAEPTDYFRGGYVAGRDRGKVTGCTKGDKDHLIARYVSDRKGSGTFDITFVEPASFRGTYTTDARATGAYTGSFKEHFGGDGAGEKVEGLCSAARKPAAVGETLQKQANCALQRVAIVAGTSGVQPEATSKHAFVRQDVYFAAVVASRVVPAAVLLYFQKEVSVGDIFVKTDSTVNARCAPPRVDANGVPFLLCRLDKAIGHVVVGIHPPTALAGKQLLVQLRVARPRVGETERQWLTDTKESVVEVEQVQVVKLPPPLPPPPPSGPAKEPIEGVWEEYVPTGARARTRFDRAFPKARLRLQRAQPSAYQPDLFATTTGGNFYVYLNNPGVKGRAYFDGTAGQASEAWTARTDIVLEIPVGQKASRFPGVCGGIAEEAKAPILCGVLGKTEAEWKRVVLKRVGD